MKLYGGAVIGCFMLCNPLSSPASMAVLPESRTPAYQLQISAAPSLLETTLTKTYSSELDCHESALYAVAKEVNRKQNRDLFEVLGELSFFSPKASEVADDRRKTYFFQGIFPKPLTLFY